MSAHPTPEPGVPGQAGPGGPWSRDFHHDFDMDSPEFNQHYEAIVDDLVRTCPMARSEENGGYWLVSRYEDVRQATQDPETFSSEALGVMLEPIAGRGPNVPEETDPPRHDQWRRVLNRYFSPTYVARYEPAIRATCDGLIDQFIADGECDIVPVFTGPLPGIVFFTQVMGMPEEDLPLLRKIAAQAIHGLPEERPAGWVALGEHVAAYLERRKEEPPRDDVIDAVLGAEFDGVPPPWEEKVSCVTTLVSGGLNTTSVVATGAVHHFASSPADRERALADPQALDRAIEEVLRFYNPAFAIGRTATRDVEFVGQSIRKGERVFVGYGAACRDPDQFPEPLRFDMDRKINNHVAFGLGPHRCIGAHLVRLDLRVALTQLLTRVKNLRLAGEPVYATSMLRELESLPVAFDPVPVRSRG